MTLKEGLQTVESAVFLALIVIGVTGLSWSFFEPDGLLSRFLGGVWDAQTQHPILIVPTLIGSYFAIRAFLNGGLVPGKGGLPAQLMVYLMVGVGIYYSYKWFVA